MRTKCVLVKVPQRHQAARLVTIKVLERCRGVTNDLTNLVTPLWIRSRGRVTKSYLSRSCSCFLPRSCDGDAGVGVGFVDPMAVDGGSVGLRVR